MVSTATQPKAPIVDPVTDTPRVARASGDAAPSAPPGAGTPVGTTPAAPKAPRGKRLVLAALGVAALVTAGVFGTRYVVWSYHHESTDDAYVEAHVVPISAKVGGYVASVAVEDNQHVRAGDVLVTLDARDYEAALDTAEAEVSSARARLTASQTKLTVYTSSVEQAQAEIIALEATEAFAKSEAQRYADIGDNAVSVQEQANAKTTADVAAANTAAGRSKLTAAQAELANGRSQVDSARADLTAAAAKLRQPQLDLAATKITAPVSGRVTRRAVEQGVYLSPAQGLFAIVPDDVFVIANFKETQLTNMRPGQAVDFTVDAYPGHVFKGHVDSVQRGTGSRFGLLPSENATGNFVKIVQRVPVKIVLDEKPSDGFTLSPGMSVGPEVKVR